MSLRFIVLAMVAMAAFAGAAIIAVAPLWT
jgi:hypothetical protein